MSEVRVGDKRFLARGSLPYGVPVGPGAVTDRAVVTWDADGNLRDNPDAILTADGQLELSNAAAYIAVGATPAQSGAARFTSSSSINWRNAAGTVDLQILAVNGDVNLGKNDGNQGNVYVDVPLTKMVVLRVNGGNRVLAANSYVAVTRPLGLGPYTVATVPAAAGFSGYILFVSDESGGAVPAYSDGVNWRRFSDGAVIS